MSGNDDLFSHSDDELLGEIGTALVDTKGVIPASLEARIETAKNWLVEKKGLLCQIVCADSRIKALLKEGNFGKELAILVVDVLEHHFLRISPVPPGAAGILFCRYAYYKMCGDDYPT